MNIKYFLTVVTGLIECLLFSGLLFGWASLRYVLQADGYYDLCSNNDWPDVPSGNETVSTESLSNFTNAVSYTAVPVSSNLSTASAKTDGVCKPQSEMLNLVFTVASAMLSFSALVNGYIFDTFGTWVARIISISLFAIGCIMMSVSSPSTSWLLFPSMVFLAIGGILMVMTNMQVGNLFRNYRSSIITALSGAFDSSSFIFLLFKVMYDIGVDLTGMFHAFAWCSILLWLRTFLFLPKRHVPFSIPIGYDYGLSDCKCQKEPESKEMCPVKADETGEAEGNESLPTGTTKVASEIVPSIWFHLRGSLFWGNVMHFSFLQLRNYFFMSSLYEWLKALAGDEVGTYLIAFGICQLFGLFFAPFNGLLIDTTSRLLKKRRRDLDLVSLRAVSYSAIATTALGTLFSIVIVIPSLPLQYVSFILQVIFRSFLYGGNFSFIASTFPNQHFGKLYGLTMFIGGLITLLQYPLFTLVMRKMDGDFFALNVVFIFVSALTILHPWNIYRSCKNKSLAAAQQPPLLN